MTPMLVGLRASLVTLVLTGILYPLAMTGLAQLLFPREANGSLLIVEGRTVGSELLAQPFRRAGYLQPRPSAVSYDATSSGGSNLGPTAPELRARARELQAALAAQNPDAPGPVPADLVTASASGLDPHLSPEAARWQVPRIARAREVAPERVAAIIRGETEGRTFGFLGEPRVNVLRVNLALDRLLGRPSGEATSSTP